MEIFELIENGDYHAIREEIESYLHEKKYNYAQ